MKKMIKSIPLFQSEADERSFWEKNDTSDYFELAEAVNVRMPNLKPSTTSISLRLSQSFLDNVKLQANKLDVPYQSLMKIWLSEKLTEHTK